MTWWKWQSCTGIGEQLRQPFAAVADDALYFNAFGFQAADGLGVKGVGFVFDFGNRKRFAADAVEQNHDAETAPEVSGVHHDVGALGRGKLCFGVRFFEMAKNGFAAAMISSCQLRCGLFACGVSVAELLRIDVFATTETFAAAVAFVTLFAVLSAVLFDLF